MQEVAFDPGSFRDRNSRVFYSGKTVYRGLSARALNEWEAVSTTRFFPRYMSAGQLVQTERTDPPQGVALMSPEGWVGFLKHETIPFISYPYEWSFGMLKDAGLLQLDLLLAALAEGFILKDASAFNLQWRGTQPMFIDIPSFEKLQPGEPWVGYRQFCQLFLYPLFLQAYKDVSFQPWLRGNIDGIDPDQCKNLMAWRDLLRPGVLTDVYLHAQMQAKYAKARANTKDILRTSGFSREMIQANVRRLKKVVTGLQWKRQQTEWSDYASTHNYTDQDHEQKATFIRKVVQARSWGLVWDLGCNTGTFSRIAAEQADYVVAVDADALAIERLYQRLRTEGNSKILPLIGNLADPAPNLGWRGLERKAFPERGKPELTLCLALIHHVVITANIPLKEFIDWLASIGTHLIIEFVTKQDPMVQTLLRNKVDHYADYELPFFEQCLAQVFDIERQEVLGSGSRLLYYAKAKAR